MVGRTLSHYRVVDRLGAGGMGEVYRAHDLKLDRDVALKVLPEGSLTDENARARFRKEAFALSRLSHPHVATLLDFDSEDGTDFLVMELVAGPALEEKLRDGPLPEKDVLRLGAQLARGLQAAHERGIVHRDLKPSNLHLTPDGLLKILDFGLARLLQPDVAPPGHTTATETAAGAVLGSPPYMAPEQLLGKPPDARTDLYSAGAVLYEMATGHRPFGSRSGVALTDAILHEEPRPPREVNASVPPGLGAMILKALDKDPQLRHQTAKELLVDLERLQVRSGSSSPRVDAVAPHARLRSKVRSRRRWAVAAAVAAGLLTAAWVLRPLPPPEITNVRPLRLDVGPEFRGYVWSTWTTDGVRLYYVKQEGGRYALYHVALDGGEPAEIPTPFEKGLEVYGYLRRESSLVVLAWPENTGKPSPVWLLPLPAGTPRRLGDLAANVVAVSPDGSRLALTIFEPTRSRIVVVGTDGSVAAPPVELRLPPRAGSRTRWSPDGERLLFSAPAPEGEEAGGWVWETTRTGAEPRPLWPGIIGDFSSDGRYVLLESWDPEARRSDLYAVRARDRPPWIRSRPVRLTRGPMSFSHVGARPRGGFLAYGTLTRGELRRFDPETGRFEPFLGGESVGMVRPSPDGEWVAWVTFPERRLWRSRRDGTERLRLTSSGVADMPSWSPDGRHIAFVGANAGDVGLSLRLVSADGGPVEVLHRPQEGTDFWDNCWLPDGRSLIFSEMAWAPGRRIRRLDLATRSVEFLEGAENLVAPKCGPGGRLLATRPPGVGNPSRPATLMLFEPARGEWVEIGPNRVAYPTWTRDGGSFCGLAFQQNRIDCYSLATRRFETLAEIGDDPLLMWVAVPWFGLDADDNPLLVFDRSTRDLYALDWEAP